MKHNQVICHCIFHFYFTLFEYTSHASLFIYFILFAFRSIFKPMFFVVVVYNVCICYFAVLFLRIFFLVCLFCYVWCMNKNIYKILYNLGNIAIYHFFVYLNIIRTNILLFFIIIL